MTNFIKTLMSEPKRFLKLMTDVLNMFIMKKTFNNPKTSVYFGHY